MGKRVKTWNLLGRLMFILAFVISVGVFFITHTGDNWIDFIINVIFDVIAALFIVMYFEACARPLAKAVWALDSVTRDILNSREDLAALWSRYSRDGSPFGFKILDERYGAYIHELQRLQKQNVITADCDIEDYIDDNTVYTAVNKPFCDQLGGIMSGLGILFTFIGLVYGLRNFDASSVDMMQSSTQALMAGIKIAFLTSIFGLIYSLLFNLTYKNFVRNSIQAVHNFQDAYTERVQPRNGHAAENAMLRLQAEQNNALERFGNKIGEQVSESIITLMQPAVQQLQDSLNNYITVSIEDQRSGMDKVVRYFLENMNTALGSIFVQLKARTEELTRWEKDTIDSFHTMSDSIGRTSKDLTQAQAYCQDMVKTMAAYTDNIQSLTTAQASVIQGMENFMADYRSRHETEDAMVRSTASAAQAAAASMDKSLMAAQSIQQLAAKMETSQSNSAQLVVEAGRQMAGAAQAVQEMAGSASADINAAAGRLDRAVRDLDGVMSRSISDSLAQMDASLAHLNDGLNHAASIVTSVAQSLRAMPKTVNSLDGDIKSSAKVIDTELKLLLKAVSDTQRSLSRFNADLDARISR